MGKARGSRRIKTMSDAMVQRSSKAGSAAKRRSRTPRSLPPARKDQTQRSLKAWAFTLGPQFQRLPPSMLVQKLREPTSELLQQCDRVGVLVQLPRAAAESVQLDVRGDILVVQAEAEIDGSHVRYYTECLLPFEADPSSIDCSYHEGILRIDLRRKGPNRTRKPPASGKEQHGETHNRQR